MVNNNNNLPPVEEIRELKDETPSVVGDQVPSFEEFMKTYQVDETSDLLTEVEYQDWVLHGPQHGPGFLGDFLRSTLGAPTLPVAASKPLLNPPATGFENKVAITTITGAALGPTAIPVGAAVWGGSEIIRNNTDNEDEKKFFGVVSDIGRDTMIGGIVGGSLELAGKAIGGTTNIFANSPRVLKSYAAAEAKYSYLGSEMASKLAENAAVETAAKMGVEAGKFFDYSNDAFDIGSDIYKHREHKDRGISYKSDCPVCNS